MKNKRSRPRQG